MPTLTPYIGTSVDRLTKMINQDNGKQLQVGVDFTYGTPVTVTSGKDGRNTKVTLTPIPGTKYEKDGPKDVFYWRLGIDALGRLPAGSLDEVQVPNVPFKIHAILPLINQALGLNLLPEEVENTEYTVQADSYTLTIVEGSLAWKPSSYTFAAHNTGEDIPLASVVVNTNLNGFEYVQPA